MKYSPSQYAEALYEALEGKQPEAQPELLRNFAALLKKNRDYRSLMLILSRYEKIFLKKRGLRKVEVESANPLSENLRKEIEEAAGSRVLLSETVNPKLVAGLKLLVDDTLLIDASAESRIAALFS